MSQRVVIPDGTTRNKIFIFFASIYHICDSLAGGILDRFPIITESEIEDVMSTVIL